MIFKVEIKDPFDIQYELKNQQDLDLRIFKIENKLSPEQLVVAYSKAEKDGVDLIEKEKQRSGWTSWLSSSVMNFMGYGGQEEGGDAKDIQQKQKKEKEEMENLMRQIEELDRSETSSIAFRDTQASEGQENHPLSAHTSVTLPVI